tara:strand:+ start:46 stop:525 length:480 start_codon:yes stop_codon:yes gene_type:complete
MKKTIIITTSSFIFLTSCNAVRDSAGVNRKVIDEYVVIESPPLVIPPNFNLTPPDQIESKNINNADAKLAKEILFGLEEKENEENSNNSVISEIIRETNAEEVDENIRDFVNQEFAGEKSSIDDETTFESEEELNEAINSSENIKIEKKSKKKKRFFFF